MNAAKEMAPHVLMFAALFWATSFNSSAGGAILATSGPDHIEFYGKDRRILQPDVRAKGLGRASFLGQQPHAPHQRRAPARGPSAAGQRRAQKDALRNRPRVQDQAFRGNRRRG